MGREHTTVGKAMPGPGGDLDRHCRPRAHRAAWNNASAPDGTQMKWRTWQDDDLSDGVHTALVMALAAVLALPWWWAGLPALINGQLPPLMGPEFGTWVFGPQALTGRAARLGGICLLTLGLAILAWGLRWTRWGEARRGASWAAWGLTAVLLYLWTHRAM